MKNYNKLPLKERKRHWEYSFKHEEQLEQREFKRLVEEKFAAYREEESKTDKERECDEVYKRLKAIEKGGAE